MANIENKIKNLNIAYIGGGSRGWAWGLMSDLAMEGKIAGNVKLYDLNYEASCENAIIGNHLSQREDVKGRWRYEAFQTLEEALMGADFVIISILPGTFKEMDSDVHVPEEYAIYQSVGDTSGPGGIVRALRTIPMFMEIAENIKAYCPEAWVINYTNPMTLCTRTLYEVFPQIKAFGCCHEVFGTQKLLASMLKDLHGIADVHHHDIKVNILGINHFTWFDSATYNGMDLFPLYREFVDKYYETGYSENKKESWKDSFFDSAHRVHFDLFRRYGLIAAAGDRHLAEFMPGTWYLRDPETVKRWKFNLTPVKWRMENKERLAQKSKRLRNKEEEFELKSSGEEGIRIIKSLLGMDDMITNVNFPNQGQIKGLPLGAIVETNALFSGNSIRPIMAGQLPVDIENLVLRHVLNQETVLKASILNNKELAFHAFINDPLVTIGVEEAEKLFNRMLQNTRNYLPDPFFQE